MHAYAVALIKVFRVWAERSPRFEIEFSQAGVAADSVLGYRGERVRDALDCQLAASVEKVECIEAREQPERVGRILGIEAGP